MRGFDTKKWNTFLGTNGEDAWRMVGNMPAQSFFDEAVTAMLLVLFQIPEGGGEYSVRDMEIRI